MTVGGVAFGLKLAEREAREFRRAEVGVKRDPIEHRAVRPADAPERLSALGQIRGPVHGSEVNAPGPLRSVVAPDLLLQHCGDQMGGRV